MLAVFTVKEKCVVVKKAGCAVSAWAGCQSRRMSLLETRREMNIFPFFLVFTLKELEEGFQQRVCEGLTLGDLKSEIKTMSQGTGTARTAQHTV